MKEKERKLRLNTFEAGESQRLADYLNQMAQKGWRLRKISWAFVHLVREEKAQGQYTVDIFHRSKHRKREEYIDLCGEAGWEYVGHNSDMYVFRAAEGESPTPIQTDPQMEYQAFRASLLPIDILFLFFCIYFLAATIGLMFFTPQSLRLLPSTLLFLPWMAVLYLPLILFYLSYVCCDFYWLAKHRRRLRQGKKLHPMPRVLVRIRQTIAVLMLACLVVFLIADGIYTTARCRENEAVARDAAPILRLADLGAEDTPEEKWVGQASGEIPLNVYYKEQAAENEDIFIWTDYYRAKDGETAKRVYEVLLADEKQFVGAVETADMSESWQTEEGILLIRPGDSEKEPRCSCVLLRKGSEVWQLRGSFALSEPEMIARCRAALAI